jgi:hypothetical protein
MTLGGKAEAYGQVTKKLSSAVVHSVLTGRVDARMIEALDRDATLLGWAPSWLIDATNILGFTPDSVPAGVRTLESGRSKGLRRIVIITKLPAARMAARTIGLAASVDLHVADDRRAADELLATPLRR